MFLLSFVFPPSASEELLRPPKIQQKKFYGEMFAVAAPTVWNTIPRNIFKKALKHFTILSSDLIFVENVLKCVTLIM